MEKIPTFASSVRGNEGKYPYWVQIVRLNISDEQKRNWEYVVSILNDRLLGKEIIIIYEEPLSPLGLQEKLRYVDAEKISGFPITLCENTPPSLAEVYSLMYDLLQIEEESDADALLISMEQQHIYAGFVHSLLK